MEARATGLLLDIGGVVLRNGTEMVLALVAREPALESVIAEIGVVAGPDDVLWQQMLRGEVTERAYWARRAGELGAGLGEVWDTRTMINRMYDLPEHTWLREEVRTLMADTKAAGLPLGALTNDLVDFHGEGWVAEQRWLDLFDVIVDASKTGVFKPDPRAFAAGAAAIGLPPGEVVYLDDMPWNVQGGLLAGLQAVRVDYDDPLRAVDEARERLALPAPSGAGRP